MLVFFLVFAARISLEPAKVYIQVTPYMIVEMGVIRVEGQIIYFMVATFSRFSTVPTPHLWPFIRKGKDRAHQNKWV